MSVKQGCLVYGWAQYCKGSGAVVYFCREIIIFLFFCLVPIGAYARISRPAWLYVKSELFDADGKSSAVCPLDKKRCRPGLCALDCFRWPLRRAVFAGDKAAIKKLLNDAPVGLVELLGEPVHQSAYDADTLLRTSPLYDAVVTGKEVVEYLASLGMSVNTANRCKQTPLHRAVATGNEKLVDALLDAGANMHAADNYGRRPLHYARFSPAITGLLARSGANVDLVDNYGNTALHMAAYPEVAVILIAHGAQVNATNYNGRTPLHLARTPEVIECLLASGADTNLIDYNGKTARDVMQDRLRDYKFLLQDDGKHLQETVAQLQDQEEETKSVCRQTIDAVCSSCQSSLADEHEEEES